MTKLTGTFHLTAAVNTTSRRIVGQVVPFGEVGNPGLNGQGIQLEIHAGGLTWDPDNMPKLRSTHHTEPIGRAVTLDESPTGIVAAFTVAKTTAGDDALTLAADGLQAGLSIEADAPDGITADTDGVYRLTAENPAPLTAIALVEVPAFASAQVSQVAAKKEVPVMADQVTAAEVPDEALTGAIESLTNVVTALSASLAPDETEDTVEASALPTRRNPVQVTGESFPYGHPGAEGVSLFADIHHGKQGDSVRAARADKALDMMGPNPFAARNNLTAANEPIVRSTLAVPNSYDVARYVEQLKFERVVCDATPGVSISSAQPILVPSFTSFRADGGTGEPVVSGTAEGANPAQAELVMAFQTATPLRYTGLTDVSREALDAAVPGLDQIIMGALLESYAQVTETAASVQLITNGTAGTDVTTDASTEVEARAAQKYIRGRLAAFETRRGMPADQVLFGSATYAAAVSADNLATGLPLYPWYSPSNTAGAVTAPAGFRLNVNGVEGRTGFRLTADQFVLRKFADSARWESPTLGMTTGEGPLAPGLVRFAVFGYMIFRNLQPTGIEYFKQL